MVARGVGKAAGADDEAEGALARAADSLDYEPLGEVVRPELEAVAKDAARLGMEQVETNPIDALLSQANENAEAWARRRAGELVTQVSQTTRDAVADLTAQALEEGWSTAELADALDSSDVFGEARAEMIARTETAMADIQGNLIGWRESGVVDGKRWIVADANECDDCAALDGEVASLDEDFPEGDPPLHPNCRCDLVPVLSADDEE